MLWLLLLWLLLLLLEPKLAKFLGLLALRADWCPADRVAWEPPVLGTGTAEREIVTSDPG